MKKFAQLIVILCVIVAGLGASTDAYTQSIWPTYCQESSLPSQDQQYPDDQLIITCIPPAWNGDLVIYAHGYVPAQYPLAVPVDQLYLPDGTFVPEMLMNMGYAFATTSYHKNGYAVKQASGDLNDLLSYFKTLIPSNSLNQVLLIGASEGAIIAAMMVENYPHRYDGALALCGPIGGMAYQVQYLTDFRVVFDYFFPTVFSFGAMDIPLDAYANWASYMLAIGSSIITDPLATSQLLNVTHAAIDPFDPSTAADTAVSILFYSIWGTNDMINTARGIPYDNMSTVYTGSLDDDLLNAVVERIQSDGRARSYIHRFYQTTGKLHIPLVTMHNTYDPVVPFQHEEIYTDLVTGNGDTDLLTVIPIVRYGHCNFTTPELQAAFALLIQQTSFPVEP